MAPLVQFSNMQINLTAFRNSKEMVCPPTLEEVKQMASEPLRE